MNTNIYFKGDAEHGAEIIEILKSEGGRNENNLSGCDQRSLYFIGADGVIDRCGEVSPFGREVMVHRLSAELLDCPKFKIESLLHRLGFIKDHGEPDIRIISVKRPTLQSAKIGFYIADDLDAELAPIPKQKTEFAVGEVFQCGLVQLKVEEGKGCKNCYFCESEECSFLENIVGECVQSNRKDGTSVIFKKVE